MEPLKKARDCDCACHKGAVVVHVVPCCDAPVPMLRDPRKPQKPESYALPEDAGAVRGVHGSGPPRRRAASPMGHYWSSRSSGCAKTAMHPVPLYPNAVAQTLSSVAVPAAIAAVICPVGNNWVFPGDAARFLP